MRIERLCVDNLREGIFCTKGRPNIEEMYGEVEAWLDGNRLKGQIAREDNGKVVGFVLYCHIEETPLAVEGRDLYMVHCIFVRPEVQYQGIARALIESTITDAKNEGALGIAAQGFQMEPGEGSEFVPAAFFQHVGMKSGESQGPDTLYYVGFNESTKPPRFLDPRFSPPVGKSKLRIDILDCRHCHLAITNREVIKAVVESAERDDLELVIHDHSTRQAVLDKGMSAGVFIDGRLTFMRGTISEEDIWNAIDVADAARNRALDR